MTLRKTFSGSTSSLFSPAATSTRQHRTGSSWFGRTSSAASKYDEAPDAVDYAAEEPEDVLGLDMTLGTLGKTRMVFTDRGWQLDNATVQKYEGKLEELTQQLNEVQWQSRKSEAELLRQQQQLQQRATADAGAGTALVQTQQRAPRHESEDVATLKFKNQLLIEMLAIAQLDESHVRQSYDREKVKAEEYRRELERCYSRMLHHGIDPGTSGE